MKIQNQIFKLEGKKMESLVLAENAIQISSSSYSSIEEFNTAWGKTLSLATKTEVKYDVIKSIAKEAGESELVVKFRGLAGVPNAVDLKFPVEGELDAFYQYFQNEKGFVRTDVALSPIKAILPYLGGLAVAAFVIPYAYSQAASMAAGEYVANESTGRSARRGNAVDSVIGMLGTTGVLLIGLAVTAYIGYMIWTRFKNPPIQTLLVPGK